MRYHLCVCVSYTCCQLIPRCNCQRFLQNACSLKFELEIISMFLFVLPPPPVLSHSLSWDQSSKDDPFSGQIVDAALLMTKGEADGGKKHTQCLRDYTQRLEGECLPSAGPSLTPVLAPLPPKTESKTALKMEFYPKVVGTNREMQFH